MVNRALFSPRVTPLKYSNSILIFQNVLQILLNRFKEGLTFDETTEKGNCFIESLILIDRECDLFTPMCTPYTYQALLDDFFNISKNTIKVNKKILSF
jgi:hypothetical protein